MAAGLYFGAHRDLAPSHSYYYHGRVSIDVHSENCCNQGPRACACLFDGGPRVPETFALKSLHGRRSNQLCANLWNNRFGDWENAVAHLLFTWRSLVSHCVLCPLELVSHWSVAGPPVLHLLGTIGWIWKWPLSGSTYVHTFPTLFLQQRYPDGLRFKCWWCIHYVGGRLSFSLER